MERVEYRVDDIIVFGLVWRPHEYWFSPGIICQTNLSNSRDTG